MKILPGYRTEILPWTFLTLNTLSNIPANIKSVFMFYLHKMEGRPQAGSEGTQYTPDSSDLPGKPITRAGT